MVDERAAILHWFDCGHLPEHLQQVTRPYQQLAEELCRIAEPGPERSVALRDLLRSKDAAVRALIKPGG